MGNSRTYRSRSVESVDMEKMLEGREGQKAWVGVDVGKDSLYMVVRWADGEYTRPIVVSQPGNLRKGLALLKRLAEGRELGIALEPSGTYGDSFRYQCHLMGLRVCRVETRVSCAHAVVFDGVPSQHDGKDAAVLADLGSSGKAGPWDWQGADEVEESLAWSVAMATHFQKSEGQWRGRLEGLLAKHWPGITELLGLEGRTLHRLLLEYGSPAALALDAGAAEKLKSWGGWFLTEEKVAAVLASARENVGAPMGEAARAAVREVVTEMDRATEGLERHRRMAEEKGRQSAMVEQLGGELGQMTAVVLAVEAGDAAKYPSASAYVKGLGLNLVERSSGRQKSALRISKRGSAMARQWLYLFTLRLIRGAAAGGTLERWYEAKVARDGGKGKGRALTAVMRRVARGIWHCRRTGKAFDAEKLFAARGEKVAPAKAEVAEAELAAASV